MGQDVLVKIRKYFKNDKGFTLTEMIVALGLLAVLMSSLASVLSFATKASMQNQSMRKAASIMQNEVDAISVANWDDIMLAPADTDSPSLCPLGSSGLRASAQIVKPISVLDFEDQQYLIERDVRWLMSNAQIKCNVSPNDRADLKIVTLTVSWNMGGETYKRTATVVASRYRGFSKEITRAAS